MHVGLVIPCYLDVFARKWATGTEVGGKRREVRARLPRGLDHWNLTGSLVSVSSIGVNILDSSTRANQYIFKDFARCARFRSILLSQTSSIS